MSGRRSRSTEKMGAMRWPKTRTAATLAILATSACGGGASVLAPGVAPLTTPSSWPPAPEGAGALATCEHVDAEPLVSLAGLDQGLRDAFAERVKGGEQLLVVAVTARGCGSDVALLGCSRKATYRVTPRDEAEENTVVGASSLGRVIGGERLVTRADGHALLLEETWTTLQEVSWLDDLTKVHWPMRFGAMRESFAPRVEKEDLVGPDCARATHYVSSFREGGYVVRRARPGGRWDDGALETSRCRPPACAEPIALELEPLAAPVPPPTGPVLDPRELPKLVCPVRSKGTSPSNEAVQAQRLFDSGRWREAAPAVARVARGETADEPLMRHRFGWMAAVALDRMGERKRAAAIMNAIASTPCHPAHDEAAYYMSVLERRGAP